MNRNYNKKMNDERISLYDYLFYINNQINWRAGEHENNQYTITQPSVVMTKLFQSKLTLLSIWTKRSKF